MASPASTKKQIVDSIKQASSILVTVSRNPSVDELSAALGLTIFLNKLDKHATAVFSGQVPPAITFLEPNKTFESTADSLRDFIIALDKEKADHLRYKVVDESVKIFITPYRTIITEDDLKFSQGDYNVELVIALNVENSDYLDAALSVHGKILHNAEVATVTAGHVKSELGTIDWHEDDSSGVSEMLVGLINELKTGKAGIDEQIATALLTGIVSATDRFGNEATSSRGMTVAATLMAAGANPQLIASKLEEASQPDPEDYQQTQYNVDGSTSLREGTPTKLTTVRMVSGDDQQEDSNEPPEPRDEDGVMRITHDRHETLDEVTRKVMKENQRRAAKAAKAKLDRLTNSGKKESGDEQPSNSSQNTDQKDSRFSAGSKTSKQQPAAVATPPDITEDLRKTTEEITGEPVEPQSPSEHLIGPSIGVPTPGDHTPMTGGTLNATTAQAAEDKRRAMQLEQNRMILKHGKPIGSRVPSLASGTFNASMAPSTEQPTVDIFAGKAPSSSFGLDYEEAPAPVPSTALQQSPQFDPQAVQAAAEIVADVPGVEVPQAPIPQPAPPVFGQAPEAAPPQFEPPQAPMPAPPEYGQSQQQFDPPQFQSPATPPQSQPLGGGPTLAEIEARSLAASAPQPPLPPMPDFNSLPPMPSMPPGVDPAALPGLPSVPPNQGAQPPAEFNPSQFQIPAK